MIKGQLEAGLWFDLKVKVIIATGQLTDLVKGLLIARQRRVISCKSSGMVLFIDLLLIAKKLMV